jgi:hypothetical protein
MQEQRCVILLQNWVLGHFTCLGQMSKAVFSWVKKVAENVTSSLLMLIKRIKHDLISI